MNYFSIFENGESNVAHYETGKNDAHFFITDGAQRHTLAVKICVIRIFMCSKKCNQSMLS